MSSIANSVAQGIFRPLDHFRGARDGGSPRARLEEIRRRAARLRDEMLAEAPVAYYRSFDLVRVPYPTRYALLNAAAVSTPFLHIVNKLIVVQFRSDAGLKTLLISPSDVRANKETPFFKRLTRKFGPLRGVGERLLGPVISTVEASLASIGLAPADVDYISYDHLHTQDLRRWLGTRDEPAYFPRAKLLVTGQEWASARGLLPTQA
ncbi:MAG TPA: hypothetical protein VHF22_08860, partial [Planctomycetota bacterium]|nr:hypothetical protein [Planctomycetota bacterium]